MAEINRSFSRHHCLLTMRFTV